MKKTKILIFFLVVVGFFGATEKAWAVNNSIFSVSVWVKSATSVASIVIMGKAEEMRVATDATGHPLCQIMSGATWQTAVVSSDVITVDQWAHIACAYDLANFKIFINGELKGTQALTTVADDTAALWQLGRDASAGTPYGNFSGLIDDYKFYTYALSGDEIKILYNNNSAMIMGEDSSRDNNGTAVTGANKEYCVPGDTARCDKPVLELKMDEKSGTTAFDTSGNGNNGTLNGGPIWDRGKSGSAIKFDGVDDYAQVLDSSNLHLADFSLSFWIKPNAWVNNARVITKYDSYSTMDWELMYFNGLYLNIGESAAELVLPLNYTPPVGQWTYISITKNSNNWQMFANGISLGEDTSTATWTDSDNIHIGAQDSAGPFFNGQIDDVKIYNYARTPAQIAWGYNRGKEINHWKFDEGTGPTVHDEGAGLNHGTITGATWKNESECRNGKCLFFNGQDLTRVDADTQDNMSQFTACAWVKASALSNPDGDSDAIILNKLWYLSLLQSGKLSFTVPTSGGYPRATISNSIDINKWYRVCGAYYGVNNSPKIFLNGVEQSYDLATSGNGIQSNDSAAIFRIGASSNEYFGNFYGYIDNTKVYNYGFTSKQASDDYSGGAVNFK